MPHCRQLSLGQRDCPLRVDLMRTAVTEQGSRRRKKEKSVCLVFSAVLAPDQIRHIAGHCHEAQLENRLDEHRSALVLLEQIQAVEEKAQLLLRRFSFLNQLACQLCQIGCQTCLFQIIPKMIEHLQGLRTVDAVLVLVVKQDKRRIGKQIRGGADRTTQLFDRFHKGSNQSVLPC